VVRGRNGATCCARLMPSLRQTRKPSSNLINDVIERLRT
jgi:hypothetical protein